jgi:F420-0:gamma-glutamyl ligase
MEDMVHTPRSLGHACQSAGGDLKAVGEAILALPEDAARKLESILSGGGRDVEHEEDEGTDIF